MKRCLRNSFTSLLKCDRECVSGNHFIGGTFASTCAQIVSLTYVHVHNLYRLLMYMYTNFVIYFYYIYIVTIHDIDIVHTFLTSRLTD